MLETFTHILPVDLDLLDRKVLIKEKSNSITLSFMNLHFAALAFLLLLLHTC